MKRSNKQKRRKIHDGSIYSYYEHSYSGIYSLCCSSHEELYSYSGNEMFYYFSDTWSISFMNRFLI